MIEILDPRSGETIYDPACGTGGMLLGSVQHVEETGNNIKLLWGKLFGQEKNLTTSSIARINLFLHVIEDLKFLNPTGNLTYIFILSFLGSYIGLSEAVAGYFIPAICISQLPELI